MSCLGNNLGLSLMALPTTHPWSYNCERQKTLSSRTFLEYHMYLHFFTRSRFNDSCIQGNHKMTYHYIRFTYRSPFCPLPNYYSVQDIDPWICSKYKLIELNKTQSVFPSEWCHPGKNSWVVILIISFGNKFADTWTEHICKILRNGKEQPSGLFPLGDVSGKI